MSEYKIVVTTTCKSDYIKVDLLNRNISKIVYTDEFIKIKDDIKETYKINYIDINIVLYTNIKDSYHILEKDFNTIKYCTENINGYKIIASTNTIISNYKLDYESIYNYINNYNNGTINKLIISKEPYKYCSIDKSTKYYKSECNYCTYNIKGYKILIKEKEQNKELKKYYDKGFEDGFKAGYENGIDHIILEIRKLLK